eukprot:gnl/Spiro4/15576_TR8371_c0_g1_i1.p1 gnl/Spiro4/15576_TR8371_c0_g1~~gnl/Spiro4/15576_TR8371_c0_g1_i1.p1  ORF type:complete len:303 (-),score=62.94 gnl/Spiro4/15576_TR8371_c0_g1_i1:13-921(-)
MEIVEETSPTATTAAVLTGPSSRRVVIMPSAAKTEGVRTVVLPHPRAAVPAKYLISASFVLELTRHTPPPRNPYDPNSAPQPSCWFVGDSVEKDGGLYLASPIDVLLLALPFLDSHRSQTAASAGRFVALDEILFDANWEDLRSLKPFLEADRTIEQICEVKDVGGDRYLRLSDSLVLQWLVAKVERVQTKLEQLEPQLNRQSLLTPTATQSSANLRAAVAIVAGYLNDKWRQQLTAHFGPSLTEQFTYAADSSQAPVYRQNSAPQSTRPPPPPAAKKKGKAPVVARAGSMGNIASFCQKKS